jgi:hypothetical protein
LLCSTPGTSACLDPLVTSITSSTRSQYGHDTYAAHGPEWAWIYCDLVREQLGEDAYDELVTAFELERVVQP